MKKLLLAYSGGLDTSFCVHYLHHQLGYEVHTALVDTGGFAGAELADIEARAYRLGATSFRRIDALEDYYQQCIKFLIFGNVLRNNTYPLSVSAERTTQALALSAYAAELGVGAIAHGSTGAGNDQVRFDLVFLTQLPEVEIITPIRDMQWSRAQTVEYLREHGFDWTSERAKYSINKGIWGTSVGGVETLTAERPLPDSAFPSPLTATGPREVEVTFERGEVCAINGQVADPITCIQRLQNLAAPYAIGRDHHVGDTIIGIKGRVGFEAAAALLLIKSHHLLEKHTLSKWQQYWKGQLAEWYGMSLHEGQYLDPVMRNIEGFLQDSQERVSGTVSVKLYPYRFELLGCDSPFDLMRSKAGTYGEANRAWTGEEARGFIKITANAHRIYQQAGQVPSPENIAE